jgi:hypothetical protein
MASVTAWLAGIRILPSNMKQEIANRAALDLTIPNWHNISPMWQLALFAPS